MDIALVGLLIDAQGNDRTYRTRRRDWKLKSADCFFTSVWLVVNEAIIELPAIYFVTHHFDWPCIVLFEVINI